MNRFRSMATVALLCIVLSALWGCVSSGTKSGGSPTITTTSIPSTATVGLAYAGATISTSGGTPPLSYSVSSGQLPSGITLSRTGSISGTPRAAGTFMFVVQVQDSNNPPLTAVSPQFTITVANPTAPTVQCPSSLPGTFALGSTVNVTFTATG